MVGRGSRARLLGNVDADDSGGAPFNDTVVFDTHIFGPGGKVQADQPDIDPCSTGSPGGIIAGLQGKTGAGAKHGADGKLHGCAQLFLHGGVLITELIGFEGEGKVSPFTEVRADGKRCCEIFVHHQGIAASTVAFRVDRIPDVPGDDAQGGTAPLTHHPEDSDVAGQPLVVGGLATDGVLAEFRIIDFIKGKISK